MSASSAERQAKHRERNRAVDIGPRALTARPAHAAASLVVHMVEGEEPLCGARATLIEGKPERSRWCVTCLGHVAYASGLADDLMRSAQ